MTYSLSGTEQLKIHQEMKQKCSEFFKKLENANLITGTPIKEFDARKYLIWLNRDESLIRNGKLELVSHMDSIISDKFPKEDFEKFLIALSVYQFTIKLEQLKDVFLDCLDLEKIKLRNNEPTFGEIISAINEKIYPIEQISEDKKEIAKKIRKENYNLFFIEFRNVIIHRKYVIGSTKITYVDKNNEEQQLLHKDIAKMLEEFSVLQNYIYEYRNKLEESQN